MSKTGGFPFEPDYAVPPGWILEDYLQAWNVSQDELARRTGLSLEIIEGLVAGESGLDEDIASKLENVFDLKAVVWLSLEEDYRQRLEQGRKIPEFDIESVG